MAQGDGFPRIRCHVEILALATGGTCRVEHLDVIIPALGLPNGISPLLVHEGRDLTVCLLSAFEQFVSCDAKEDLSVDRVRAHERPAIGQGLGRLVDLTLAEDRVRARSARGARQAQEVRRRRTQPEEEGHRAEYAARGEWRRLRTGAAGSGSGRVRW